MYFCSYFRNLEFRLEKSSKIIVPPLIQNFQVHHYTRSISAPFTQLENISRNGDYFPGQPGPVLDKHFCKENFPPKLLLVPSTSCIFGSGTCFVDEKKLGGVSDTPECCVAIQMGRNGDQEPHNVH